MNDQKCAKCGATFSLGRVPTVLERLTSDERYVPPDTDLYVTCPNCGHRQLATERRFFGGRIGPKPLQYVLYAFAAIFLTFIAIAVLDALGVVKFF